MATLRQKKLAKAIVENTTAKDAKSAGQLLESVGYAKNTSIAKPGEIIEQKGVQEELANLGFTIEGAKKVVESILYDKRVKPDTRINAAKEVFKVTGGYAPEKTVSLIAHIDAIEDKALSDAAKVYGAAAIQRKVS